MQMELTILLRENIDLRKRNDELVQQVQYLKIVAGKHEEEKLALLKEINEVRHQLGQIKNGSRGLSVKLEAALQAGYEKTLAHIGQASNEIATLMEVTKSYIREMHELDTVPSRWSAIGGTPLSERSERVHTVPPTLVGDKSEQLDVSLSRSLFNLTSTTSAIANQEILQRAMPTHMLIDVLFGLNSKDAWAEGNNFEMDAERNSDLNDSKGDLQMKDDAQQLSEVEESEALPRLSVLPEDMEENDEITAPSRDANDVQQDVVSPISYVTLGSHNSQRERHGDRIEWGEQVEQNERMHLTDRDEHSYQNEHGNGSDHSEINMQQDRTEHKCRGDEIEFIAESRNERYKPSEHSRNKQKVYEAQSDQHNYSDPNEHASESVSRERTNCPVRNDHHDRLERDHSKGRTDHRERKDVRQRSNQRNRCDHADCERSERTERNNQNDLISRSVLSECLEQSKCPNQQKRSDRDDHKFSSELPKQSDHHDRGDPSESRVRNTRRGRNNKVLLNDPIENVSCEKSGSSKRRERPSLLDRSDRNDYKSSSELPVQSVQDDRGDRSESSVRYYRTTRSGQHYGDDNIENNISRRDKSVRARSSSKDSDSESVSESITEGRPRRARKWNRKIR